MLALAHITLWSVIGCDDSLTTVADAEWFLLEGKLGKLVRTVEKTDNILTLSLFGNERIRYDASSIFDSGEIKTEVWKIML